MRDTLVNLAVAAGTLSLLFLVFETVQWLRFERKHGRMVERYEGRELCSRRAEDPRLIYTFVPNRCGANSKGFMDDDHPYENSGDTYRIVIIGDSVAQGQGVPRDRAFGKLLEQRLNSHDPDRPVESINLARTGYSTSQEILVLEAEGLRYQPDLVIWSYTLNDPAHPVFHDANGDLGRYFHEPRSYTLHFIRKKLFRAGERMKRAECGEEYHALLHCAHRDQVTRHLARLGDISRTSGTPLVFVIHPVFVRGRDFASYSLESVHEDLTSMARDAGLHVVDLWHAFKEMNPAQLHQDDDGRFDPWHPNERGHQVISDYLYEALAELEFGVPGQPGGSRDREGTTPRCSGACGPRARTGPTWSRTP
jgi:lysophospholipase L1-like esterase